MVWNETNFFCIKNSAIYLILLFYCFCQTPPVIGFPSPEWSSQLRIDTSSVLQADYTAEPLGGLKCTVVVVWLLEWLWLFGDLWTTSRAYLSFHCVHRTESNIMCTHMETHNVINRNTLSKRKKKEKEEDKMTKQKWFCHKDSLYILLLSFCAVSQSSHSACCVHVPL